MPDASRVQSADPAFAPTEIMEPQEPSPAVWKRSGANYFFTSGDADPLRNAPGRRFKPITFPSRDLDDFQRDLDDIERIGLVAADREHQAILDEAAQSVREATREAALRAHRQGYAEGWWFGIAFGAMCGIAGAYFAMKIGFAFGGGL